MNVILAVIGGGGKLVIEEERRVRVIRRGEGVVDLGGEVKLITDDSRVEEEKLSEVRDTHKKAE